MRRNPGSIAALTLATFLLAEGPAVEASPRPLGDATKATYQGSNSGIHKGKKKTKR